MKKLRVAETTLYLSLVPEYQDWMKTEHIPDIVATGLVESVQLVRMEIDQTSIAVFEARMTFASPEAHDTYNKEHAPGLGGKWGARWGKLKDDAKLSVRRTFGLIEEEVGRVS